MPIFDTNDRTGACEFPYPKEVVLRAAHAAVRATSGMTVEHVDKLAARIDVKSGMSLNSFGEHIAMTVSANGAQSAFLAVQSSSGSGGGLPGWLGAGKGKPAKNVRKLITATSEILQRSGAATRDELGLNPTSAPVAPVTDELAKLASLRDQGVLTEAEFGAHKARLLTFLPDQPTTRQNI